jgi:hypothetical protein
MAVMDYRTRDGRTDYGFSIEFQPGIGWRVYVVFDPFRKGQDDSPSLPYQRLDTDGRRYVDWPSQLDNLGDAKTVAGLWVELVQRYQRAQEQHNFYVDLIQRYRHAQEQRRDDNETAKDPNASSESASDAA